MTDGTPGWFRDPSDPSLARWHDGQRWTEHTLVIADQTPGVEPEPPDLGEPTVATPIIASEPEFHIPRPARGLGRAGGGSWPTWAKVGAPIAVLVLALGAWIATSGGDDDPDEAETTDTIPASLDDAVDAARRAGLPDEVSDAQAAALIERICSATTRPSAVEQLGEDLGRLPGVTSVSQLRQSVGALGVGAELRCRDDLEAAPDLIDELQDLAVATFASTTTSPTVLPTDEGTDSVAAASDGGGDDGTDGGTRATTRTTARRTTTTRGTTTTTAKPLPQVLPNTACSPEGAKAQNKVTGGSLTCMKKCSGSGLQWRASPCPTTPTTPSTQVPPSFPTSTPTTSGTGGTTGGPTTGGT